MCVCVLGYGTITWRPLGSILEAQRLERLEEVRTTTPRQEMGITDISEGWGQSTH